MAKPDDGAGLTVDAQLGQRIRLLRKARGLALRDVAEAARISASFVSQIERGLSSASVKTLTSLADALGVGIADFFAGHAQAGPEGNIVARVRDRRHFKFGKTGIVKELLTPFGNESQLDLFLMHLEPDALSHDSPYSHQGVEAGVVLEGGFEVEVEGRTYILGEGDACGFESSRPHRFRNAGRRKAVVVWVNYRTSG